MDNMAPMRSIDKNLGGGGVIHIMTTHTKT